MWSHLFGGAESVCSWLLVGCWEVVRVSGVGCFEMLRVSAVSCLELFTVCGVSCWEVLTVCVCCGKLNKFNYLLNVNE